MVGLMRVCIGVSHQHETPGQSGRTKHGSYRDLRVNYQHPRAQHLFKVAPEHGHNRRKFFRLFRVIYLQV
ncbi:hypothetical protein GCM10007901_01710 [Dyella acidisoli]|uniref:Uncharacterized protein n=1 Tax=Dyella acidisoli TaxID=1867834 RepID=A0ABQ5XKV4_9GAMM|nr:hypothetical protein GCM10007901_01710 [Dyella acidisoli]